MSRNHPPEFKYRPDVDGLRAVAVTLVILFHAGLAFPGGFVGVDVFFVISGYLITGLLLKQHLTGRIDLRDFWSRRIRRILPAALVMTTLTMVAGFFLLFPEDFEELARSALAHNLLHANVFFAENTGYFDGPADAKPLLHTWSLAVEEQFYLIYPLLLLAILRPGRSHAVTVLVVAALVSLWIGEWSVRPSPESAYFLLPGRAWELLVGALLCFTSGAVARRRFVCEVGSVIGLAMVLFAAVQFDSNTLFPGLSALVPCAGTAILIYSNSASLTYVGRVLALRPVVFLGLLSYSLYLWHWPALAFVRYWFGEEAPVWIVVTAVVTSLFLAYLSWRFVETPMRRKTLPERERRLVFRICATVPALIVASLVVIAADGFPGRIPEVVAQYRRAAEDRTHFVEVKPDQIRRGELPVFGSSDRELRCMVFGDSHAIALMTGVIAAGDASGTRIFQVTHSSTAPIVDFVSSPKAGLRHRAPDFCRAAVDFAIRERVDVVVLGAYWSHYVKRPGFESRLQSTLDALSDAGMSVAIVLDVAKHDQHVPIALARGALFGLEDDTVGVSSERYEERNRLCNQIIRRVAEGRAVVLDPGERMRSEDGTWVAELDGKVLYYDSNHLTGEGGLLLKPLFEDLFRAVLDQRARGRS